MPANQSNPVGFRVARQRSTREDFDTLPRVLRDAYNNADQRWDVLWAVRNLEKGIPAEALAAHIVKCDAQARANLWEQREAQTALADLGL